MAKTTVRFVVEFTIDAATFDGFAHVSREMIALTQQEPGTLAYDWFLSADRTQCRLYESYIDGNAAAAHMAGHVVQVLVPRLLEFSKLTRFEVYGEPGPAATAMLTGAGAAIFGPWLAISR